MKKILSVILTAVMLFSLAACGNNKQTDGNIEAPASQSSAASAEDVKVLGKGATEFPFTVTDLEGTETKFEIHTDEKTVGEALLALGLIEGDNGDYGLYVKTVNGTTLDYDKDSKYWAFYIDGEYAMTGVDLTEITPGAVYSFKAE